MGGGWVEGGDGSEGRAEGTRVSLLGDVVRGRVKVRVRVRVGVG